MTRKGLRQPLATSVLQSSRLIPAQCRAARVFAAAAGKMHFRRAPAGPRRSRHNSECVHLRGLAGSRDELDHCGQRPVFRSSHHPHFCEPRGQRPGGGSRPLSRPEIGAPAPSAEDRPHFGSTTSPRTSSPRLWTVASPRTSRAANCSARAFLRTGPGSAACPAFHHRWARAATKSDLRAIPDNKPRRGFGNARPTSLRLQGPWSPGGDLFRGTAHARGDRLVRIAAIARRCRSSLPGAHN